ncbi:MAG: GAF domain-containing protein, partial [Polyangiaceae bacterium]|nr:GAF domain-containing protein [Polyangiaceae bacterium]
MTIETPPPGLPWQGQPYSVKRHGVTITNCDAEPVQTPGCVQDHGVLLVLRLADLTVLQASENAGRWLDHAAEGLLGRPIAAALGASVEARLRDCLAREPTEHNPLYVLTLPARGAVPPLDVSVHTVDGVVVVEFEAAARADASEPDYYGLVKKAIARLQGAATLAQFCDVAASALRTLTGFDRAMVYRFHADGHGEVVAESKRDELPPWRGLHYPASDIPEPARAIFRQVWARPLPDVAGGLAELVPLVNPDTGKPLTMTYCALRGASVMHTEYLQNMKVTAGLTLSLRRDGELWGLLACHHYAGPKHLPYQVRAACEFFAQIVSLQYREVEAREHLAYRLKLDEVHHQLVAAAAREGGLAAMTEGAPTLLDAIEAGGAAVYHRDRWWRVGATPAEADLDALAAWLGERPEFASPIRPAYATEALALDHPPAAAFADVASGLLAVPLSRNRRNLLLWFRGAATGAAVAAGRDRSGGAAAAFVARARGRSGRADGRLERRSEPVERRARRLRLRRSARPQGALARHSQVRLPVARRREHHPRRAPPQARGAHAADAAHGRPARLSLALLAGGPRGPRIRRDRLERGARRGDRDGRRAAGRRADRDRGAAAATAHPLRPGALPRDIRQPAVECLEVQRSAAQACRSRVRRPDRRTPPAGLP